VSLQAALDGSRSLAPIGVQNPDCPAATWVPAFWRNLLLPSSAQNGASLGVYSASYSTAFCRTVLGELWRDGV
jgi:hypothetical protein